MDLGGLIRGAIGGAQDAAAEVLIRYRADTSELDKASQKLEAQAAKETQIEEAKTAKLKVLQEQEIALQQKYTQISQDLFRARAFQMDADIRQLSAHKIAVEQQIQVSQNNQAAIQREITLLREHSAMLTSDAAAMRARAAGAVAPGLSGAGAAVLGGIGAAGTMIALNGLMALQKTLQDSTRAWAEYGHAIEHVAKLTGASAEQASQFVGIAQMFGLSIANVGQALSQLTRHMASNEAQFNALGVKTRDANGQLINQLDVFNQMREVMSRGGASAEKLALQLETMTRSASGASMTIAEWNQILGLNETQVAELTQTLSDLGLVLDDQAAQDAAKFYNELRTTETAQRGLSLAISRELMPTMQGINRMFLTGIVAAQSWGETIRDVLAGAIGGGVVGAVIGGPLGAAIGALTGGVAGGIAAKPGKSLDEINAEVDRLLKSADDIIKLQDAGSGYGNGLRSDLAAQRQAETQAIRDQIDALREAARAREDEMRTALQAYERERQAAIQSIQDTQRARDDAHNAEIKALQDEQKAADHRFRDEQEARRQQIDDLRTEVQLREQALQQEEAAYNLAQDQKNVARDQLDTTTVQGPHESIESYYKRKYDAEQKLARDTHKVVVDQKRMELDQFKAATDVQIRAIESVSKAAAEANEHQREATAKKIEDIRALMEQEKRRDESVIAGIRKQIDTERLRVQDAIKDMQTETAAQAKELEKRIKAMDAYFGAVGGGLDRTTQKAKEATAALQEMRAAIDSAQVAVHGPGGARDPDAPSCIHATVPGSGPKGSEETIPASVVMGTSGGDWWGALLGAIGAGLDPSNPNRWGGFNHDYPHSLTLTEPVLMLGRSGKNYGTAAASGSEQVSFSGVGASASGGHGHTIVVNLDGRKIGEILADRYGADIAGGYGRRA